jgi:AcrR family transcriptional regulator
MSTEKQKIIKTKALDIIGNDGLGALTIANLAGHIGVSDGAIYRHFDSKISIIKEILNDLFFEVSDQIMDEISREIAAGEKLRIVISSLYGMFERQPAYISLLFSEEYFVSDDDIFYLMHTIVNTMQLYIRQILEEGIKNREIKQRLNTTHITLLIMGSMRITVLNWRLKRSNGELNDSGKKLLETILELIRE